MAKVYYLVADEQWDELVKFGESAVEPLIQALKDRYSDVRRVAAEALGKLGDPKAIEPLTQALNDSDGLVRYNAKIALEKLKPNKKLKP